MQPRLEQDQPISHQHANGEIFAAEGLEAARSMCPVLGKMSLEEAGLLLELEALGKKQVFGQQDKPDKKPVIERVQKTQSEQNHPKKSSKLAADNRTSETLPVPDKADEHIPEPLTAKREAHTRHSIGADLAAIAAQQAEALWSPIETRNAEEADTPHAKIKGAKSTIPLSPRNVVESSRKVQAAEMVSARKAISETMPPGEHPASSDTTVHQEHYETAQTPEKKTGDAEIILREERQRTTDRVPESVPLETADQAGQVEEMLPSDSALYEEDTASPANVLEDDEVISDGEDSEQYTTEMTGEEETEHDDEDETADHPDAADDRAAALPDPEASIRAAVPELPAPIAEIDTAIEQVTAAIEADEAEEAEKIEAILEEIIALPATHEATDGADIEALGDKLEELFIELFEEADVPYTQDLLDSFVQLTATHYLEQLLANTVDAEEEDSPPDEIGTREFLQKLNHGLSAMKRAVVDFYGIGKSILRIYAYGPMAVVSE